MYQPNPSLLNVNAYAQSNSASTTLFRRLIFDGTVPIEIRLDSKELPANSDRSLECYYMQAPRISYLPLLLPEIKRHLVEIVLDDASLVKEEDWWFEEAGTGTIMKWHWPIGALYDNHTISARVAASVSTTYLNTPAPDPHVHSLASPAASSTSSSSAPFDPTPATPLRLVLHLAAPPMDKLLSTPSAEACKQAFMGQIKEADFLRWGNTKRVTGLRKQEQDGIWEGLRDHNFEEFWRIASKIFPVPSLNPPPPTAPTSSMDPHPRSQSTDPGGQGPSEKDGAYTVRSVPCRIFLPDGPVLQDVMPPLNELGLPTTLRELLRTHLPLLFPPAPSMPLAYAIVQGVVTPLDSEIAWLNACLAGVDGWLSVFIGLGIVDA
ncbi:hypothetical protein DL93DRAFT_2088313 [Clavulina sp. PMI_390]|nr:hypothetical protein DL93DRAFT_2088313 [Clavulina sp. PMI_390]